jgi:hypothetical protein
MHAGKMMNMTQARRRMAVRRRQMRRKMEKMRRRGEGSLMRVVR